MTIATPELPNRFIGLVQQEAILDQDVTDLALRTETAHESVGVMEPIFERSDDDRRLAAEVAMRLATARFMTAVASHEVIEPPSRETTITVADADSRPYAIGEWRPTVKSYSSSDPWQTANPELTLATTAMIDATMDVTRDLVTSRDPALAYLDGKRASGGRKMTVTTQELVGADPTMGQWITGLPKAEFLRPVAQPWQDTTTIVRNPKTGQLSEVASSPALIALVGGSGDGRAVREREAWERNVVTEKITSDQLNGKALRVTSLGTGTGEPAMDSGIAVVQSIIGDEGRVVVNGFDLNENSLEIAKHLAAVKGAQLKNPDIVTFNGGLANLLDKEGLALAVSSTDAHVYEAVGFAEYVPRDSATDPTEIEMREKMRRIGLLSAEMFYRTIYENMPKGAVLITGNMRSDSPQGDFVTDGLGWPGIIKRSTQEYLQILHDAGIPSDSVELYVPDSEGSAGAYNLVAISKQ